MRRMAKEDLPAPLRQQIEDTLSTHNTVLFMKGTPAFPQCGFSARVVSVLKQIGVDFHTVNVLADGDIREGIKRFTDWPTIPQLYHNGQFVGGSDIVAEMFQNGELQKVLTPKA
jgi:monothiol glutaredoxin